MENFNVISHGETRCFASWEKDGARFHVWFNEDGSLMGNTIYKNPPLSLNRGDEGYFKTIELVANNKTNSPVIAEVIRRVTEGELIAKAIQKAKDDEAAKEATEKAAYALKVRNAFKTEINTLRETGRHRAADNIRRLLAEITYDEIIRLANAIRRA